MSQVGTFELGKRPPYALKMLEEVFGMDHRDYDVLTLCAEAPLSPGQCNHARTESAKKLEQRGMLFYGFREQRWRITVTGERVLNAIAYYSHQYEPASQGKGEVLHFPTLQGKGKFA